MIINDKYVVYFLEWPSADSMTLVFVSKTKSLEWLYNIGHAVEIFGSKAGTYEHRI